MIYCFGDVDTFGTDMRVVEKLAGAEEVGEEAVVV